MTLDGQVANTPREKILAGQQVHVNVELEADTRWDAQEIELNIVYEDEHILVIDKPAGLVVHPAQAHPMAPSSTPCCTATPALPRCPVPVSCTVWIKTPPG